jgi:hypothetical protein
MRIEVFSIRHLSSLLASNIGPLKSKYSAKPGVLSDGKIRSIIDASAYFCIEECAIEWYTRALFIFEIYSYWDH